MLINKFFSNNNINTKAFIILSGCFFLLCKCGTWTSDRDYRHWNDKISVVFSSPGISPDTAVDAKIQEKIAMMIDSAQSSVEMCVYELTVPEIYEAMIRAHRRGVKVRFVGDIDCINTYEGYQALIAANIPMTLGNPEKIMHNKFVIVDDYFVTMGSANYTSTGFWKNNENVLFVQDEDVARFYKKEFNILFYKGTFGVDKDPADFTNSTQIALGFPEYSNYTHDNYYDNIFNLKSGTQLEIVFTPYIDGLLPNGYSDLDYDGDITADDRIIAAINSANEKIQFAMFSFTSNTIRNAILERARLVPGLKVEGIFDKSWHSGIDDTYIYGNEYAVHHAFINEGLDVRYDGNNNVDPGNPLHGGKCHNKFAIIDPGTPNAKVVTGSFNFSSSAATDGNDENLIIIQDVNISKLYEENFNTMFKNAKHPTRDLGGDRANVREVIFNEINWAGSRSDSSANNYADKFIELKNTTNRRINVSGWQIFGIGSSSWRITSYIIPMGTYIEPNGYFVLFWSFNGSAFKYRKNAQEYQFLYLYHGSSQKYVSLTLKDTHQNVIDTAGCTYSNPGQYGNISLDIFPWPLSRYYQNYSAEATTINTTAALNVTNWGGVQNTLGSFQSMYRSNPNGPGTVTGNWSTTTIGNGYIDSDYDNNTLATPGTD